MNALPLLSLLGKSDKSEEWNQFVGKMGQKPRMQDYSQGIRGFHFDDLGIQIGYDTVSERIIGVNVHAIGQRFSPIANLFALPANITLDDSIEQVRSKMGEPDLCGKHRPDLHPKLTATDEEWRQFLSKFESLPPTIEWMLYAHEPHSLLFLFDNGLGGSMVSVELKVLSVSQRARILMEKRDYASAIPLLENLNEKEQTGLLLASLADCYSALGEVRQAKQKHELAIQRSTFQNLVINDTRVRYAKFLEQMGEKEGAFEQLLTHVRERRKHKMFHGIETVENDLRLLGNSLGISEEALTKRLNK